ncbi:MAG: DUF3333 domain-containing protein, partial [Roseovarius sp.]|nr:DUF3333 domain-containing protein [Roseovarius sp.]
MTDMTASPSGALATDARVRSRLRRRNRNQMILQGLGLGAITFAGLMLFILIASLVSTGYKAATQTHMTIEVFVDPQEISADKLPRGGFREVLAASLIEEFPDMVEAGRKDLSALTEIYSNGAQFDLRDRVVADPRLIGQTIALTVPVSDPFDQLQKGLIKRETPEAQRRVDDRQIAWFDTLAERGMISEPINWGLLTNADSRFPELAGLRGALVGSFWALLVCFAIS